MASDKQKIAVLVRELRRNKSRLTQLRQQAVLERRRAAEDRLNEVANQEVTRPFGELQAAGITTQALQKCVKYQRA